MIHFHRTYIQDSKECPLKQHILFHNIVFYNYNPKRSLLNIYLILFQDMLSHGFIKIYRIFIFFISIEPSYNKTIQIMTETVPMNSIISVTPRSKRNIDLQTKQKKKTVNLNALEMGDEGLEYLLSKSIDDVAELKLWKNKLTWFGISTINQIDWQNLRSLYLNGNQIGNKGCYYLSRGTWASLQVLSLYNNEIDTVGCSFLSKKSWEKLVQLSLQNNKINSFNELNKMRAQNLQRLLLDLNPITEEGYLSLLKTQFAKVKQVNLINNFSRMRKSRVKGYIKQRYSTLPLISFDNQRVFFG